MKKSLTLSPTNKPEICDVFLGDGFKLLNIGKYNSTNKTFSTFRTEKKHLHRKSGSLSVNLQVLNELNPSWIEIIYESSAGKRKLQISKNYLIHFGRQHAFRETNFEPQIFLELERWNLTDAIRFEKQIHLQQSLSFA